GATGLVTVVTVGGISFARVAQSATQTPSRVEEDRSDGSTSIDAHREGGDGRERDDEDGRGTRPHKKPTPQPTPRTSPSTTHTPRFLMRTTPIPSHRRPGLCRPSISRSMQTGRLRHRN